METRLPDLPEVVMDIIEKMACIKKSNGKKGNNFIIVCRQNFLKMLVKISCCKNCKFQII